MNYVLTFLGFTLFIVLGMIKTKNKHVGKKFDPIRYLKDEVLTLIASVISAIAITLMLPEIGHILAPDFAEFGKVISFAGGYLNYSVINQLVNSVIPKKFIEK